MAKLLKKTFGLGGKKPPAPPKPDYKPGQTLRNFDDERAFRDPDQQYPESPPGIRSSSSPTSPGSNIVHPPAVHPRTTSSPQGLPHQIGTSNRLALDNNKAPVLLTDYSEPVDVKKTPIVKYSGPVDEYTEPYDMCGQNPETPEELTEEQASPTQENDFQLYDDPENCNLDDVENFEQFEEYPDDARPKEDYEDPWEWSMKNRLVTKIQSMAEQESAELDSVFDKESKKTHCEIDIGQYFDPDLPIGSRLSQSKTEEDLSSAQNKPVVEFSSEECIYSGNYEDPWDLDKMTEKLETKFKAANKAKETEPVTTKSRSLSEPQEPTAIPKGFLHDVMSSIDSKREDKKSTSSYTEEDLKPKGRSKKNRTFKKQYSSPNPVTSFTLEKYTRNNEFKMTDPEPTPAVDQPEIGQGEYEEPWDLKSKLRSAQFLQAADKFVDDLKKHESDPQPTAVEPQQECDQGDLYDEPWDLRSKLRNAQLMQVAGAMQKEHLTQHAWTRPPPDRPPPPIPTVPPPTKPPSPPTKRHEREKLNLELANRASCYGETFDPSLPLDKQIWYHGNIGRVEAENLLRVHKEGSYLVRNSESSKQDFSLSLKSARGFMHMKIVFKDNTYILGQFSQPYISIPEMIYHYRMHKLPIKGAEHMSLLYPVVTELL